MPKADAAALARAASLLGQAGNDPAGSRPQERTETIELSLPPGQTREVIRLDGPQAITALKVRLNLPADAGAQRKLLRSLVLRVTWDDDATPAIWSPLGDFFGVVGGAGPYRSLPLGLLPDGTFYSYWYMPFARRARVEVANDGPFAVADKLAHHARAARAGPRRRSADSMRNGIATPFFRCAPTARRTGRS